MKLVVSLLFLSLNCLAQPNREKQDDGPETVLRLSPGQNNPRNSEGDFLTLKDGRIIFIFSHFYGDSRSDFGSSSLVARYSADGGKNWSDKDEMVVENDGAMNVMSVSLVRLQSGKIALFYLRKNSMHDCIPMMRISTDETRSWSVARPCITDKEGYFVLNNDRVIQLQTGRLLMPLALHLTPGESKRFNENGKILCYYSDDEGITWESSDFLTHNTPFMTQEPGVVELKDGNIMMFIRSDSGKQLVSHSFDQGQSWTQISESNIVSPLSPASIKRIPSTGDLLLVWNKNDGTKKEIAGKRTPFNTAISKDEGKTWQNIKTIADHSDTRYCYTAITFNGNHVLLGHVAGLYSNSTRNSITDITRMTIDWLYK